MFVVVLICLFSTETGTLQYLYYFMYTCNIAMSDYYFLVLP